MEKQKTMDLSLEDPKKIKKEAVMLGFFVMAIGIVITIISSPLAEEVLLKQGIADPSEHLSQREALAQLFSAGASITFLLGLVLALTVRKDRDFGWVGIGLLLTWAVGYYLMKYAL